MHTSVAPASESDTLNSRHEKRNIYIGLYFVVGGKLYCEIGWFLKNGNKFTGVEDGVYLVKRFLYMFVKLCIDNIKLLIY